MYLEVIARMGALDIEGKRYLSDNRRFADAFNYLLHDGNPVINPDDLQDVDASQIAVPYGNGARLPMEKYRDLFKFLDAKTDGKLIYILLGIELQGFIHYAMPVKNGLYDMIGYSKQAEEAGKSHRKKRDAGEKEDDAKLSVENF